MSTEEERLQQQLSPSESATRKHRSTAATSQPQGESSVYAEPINATCGLRRNQLKK